MVEELTKDFVKFNSFTRFNSLYRKVQIKNDPDTTDIPVIFPFDFSGGCHLIKTVVVSSNTGIMVKNVGGDSGSK